MKPYSVCFVIANLVPVKMSLLLHNSKVAEHILNSINLNDNFANVTLKGEDKESFEAHKLVLGASSPVLKELLIDVKETNIVLLLSGYKNQVISDLMQFIYFGEVYVKCEKILDFLDILRQLEIDVGDNFAEKFVTNITSEEEKPTKDEVAFQNKKEKIRKLENSEEFIDDDELERYGFQRQISVNMDGTYCKICNSSFKSTFGLKTHNDSIHLKIKHICTICERSFAQKASLNLHIRSLHDGIRHKCDFCNHEATTKGNLKLHSKMHMNSKIHKCDLCGHVARTKGDLKFHSKVHMNMKIERM